MRYFKKIDHTPDVKLVSPFLLFCRDVERTSLHMVRLFILVSIILANPAQSKDSAEDGSQAQLKKILTEKITEEIDREDTIGLNVAVFDSEKIIYQKGFGYSDVFNDVETDHNTQYQGGAITGILTGALIVKLKDLGLLSLDDPIDKYLPGNLIQSNFSNANQISIRNLLTHHSGLPLNIFKGSWAKKPESINSLLSEDVTLRASYPPDYIYAFSNIGYSLLGLIAQEVTRKSFSSAMNTYIFTPLKMSNSSMVHTNNVGKLATGYRDGEEATRIFPRDTPSVGLVSTVSDLSKFFQQYLRRGSDNTLEETITQQNAHVLLDLEKQVGFTWYIGGTKIKNAGKVIWRGGATPNFRSRVVLLPEKHIGVVVMSNDSRSWDVIEKVSDASLSLLLEHRFNIAQPEEDELKEKIPQLEGVKPGSFNKFYSSFLGRIELVKTDELHNLDLLGWEFNLVPDKKSLGWYELQYDLLGFIPIDISWIANLKISPVVIKNEQVLLAYYNGKQYLVGKAFESGEIHTSWKNMQGEYKISNPDALTDAMKISTGSLMIRDDALFFTYELPIFVGMTLEIPLQTRSNTTAIIPGLGTGMNETISLSAKNGKKTIIYSGYELEKVTKSIWNIFD